MAEGGSADEAIAVLARTRGSATGKELTALLVERGNVDGATDMLQIRADSGDRYLADRPVD